MLRLHRVLCNRYRRHRRAQTGGQTSGRTLRGRHRATRADDVFTAEEAFGLYESNWRVVDVEQRDDQERALIDCLTEACGRGLILGGVPRSCCVLRAEGASVPEPGGQPYS